MATEIEAYAVLDGGGVKGAALVGALAAATRAQIRFVGYGGTSAGSIVALLSCAGYSPQELKSILVGEQTLAKMVLDDESGQELKDIQSIIQTAFDEMMKVIGSEDYNKHGLIWKIVHPIQTCRNSKVRHALTLKTLFAANQKYFQTLIANRGLYRGEKLQTWLFQLVHNKLPSIHSHSFTFEDLKCAYEAQYDKPAPILKIVSSNLTYQRAQVHTINQDCRVLEAVRKSMSYPFAFLPVTEGNCLVVDGGLCSNLPVFVFNKERQQRPLPIIAIDLVLREENLRDPRTIGILDYINALLATAIDGSDGIIRENQEGLLRVPVEIHPPVNTLAFDLDKDDRERIYNHGWMAFDQYVDSRKLTELRITQPVYDPRLETLYGRYRRPEEVRPLLQIIQKDIARITDAKNIRVHAMLWLDSNVRVVTYQYGMDADEDKDLELPKFAGCSGRAIEQNGVCVADLDEARRTPSEWEMTRDQAERVPLERKTMISIVLYDLRGVGDDDDEMEEIDVNELDIIGTLSIDTITPCPNNKWAEKSDRDYEITPGLLAKLEWWSRFVSEYLVFK